MKCTKCGAETGGENEYCQTCQPSVRVLSPEERENFDGLTIQEESEDQDYWEQPEHERNVYVRHINLAPKGVLGLIIMAIIFLGLMVVALPLTVFVGLGIGVVWFLQGILGRR